MYFPFASFGTVSKFDPNLLKLSDGHNSLHSRKRAAEDFYPTEVNIIKEIIMQY